MSPEERELLNRSLALAEENNKMLHSMHRSMIMSRIVSYIYWIFIIGSLFGAYYYAQPYVNHFQDIYNGAISTLDNMKQVSK